MSTLVPSNGRDLSDWSDRKGGICSAHDGSVTANSLVLVKHFILFKTLSPPYVYEVSSLEEMTLANIPKTWSG